MFKAHATDCDVMGITEATRKERAQIILDEMYQFVCLNDADGKVLEVNKPALIGIGRTMDELRGTYMWDAAPWKVNEETPKKIEAATRAAMAGKFVRDEVLLFGGAAGTEVITLDFSAKPICGADGKVLFVLAEGRNITEKKHADLQLAEKNRELNTLYEQMARLDELKTRFFSNISHEFRTPLTLILGPLKKILSSPLTPSEHRSDLELIARSAKSLVKNVNDLLDVTKLEAGKMVANYSECDLSQLLRQIASYFELLAKDRSIEFDVSVRSSVSAQVDPEKVTRILMNLLSNAFKFTPPGGSIRMELSTLESGMARVSIADSGPGIPPHLRDAVFDRFFQVEEVSTRKHEGTGLGLSIARDFTHLHGGTLTVGESVKNGALFTLEIPLKAPKNATIRAHSLTAASLTEQAEDMQHEVIEAVQQTTSEPDEATTRLRREKLPVILVVEDNAAMRTFIADVLSSRYQIIEAQNGKQGLEKALRYRPDLILTDMMMPLMSGEQMVSELRSHADLDSTPIVLLSAKDDDELKVQTLRKGVQDYLSKPFSVDELSARIDNLLSIKFTREILQKELNSKQSGLSSLAEEISKKKRQLQEALQDASLARAEAERALSIRNDFLLIASHELRTPLTPLSMQIQLVRRHLDQSRVAFPRAEQILRVLNSSDKELERLARLVEDLLDVSKISAGRLTLRPEPVNLSALVQEVAERYRSAYASAGSTIDVDVDRELCGNWDRQRIEQVVFNLLSNALKYGSGKPVHIKVSKKQDLTLITVQDQGIGIPKEDQERIFKRFERAVSPTRFGGLGLGLYITQQIVMGHGGNVSVDSAPGLGSTFTVSLP